MHPNVLSYVFSYTLRSLLYSYITGKQVKLGFSLSLYISGWQVSHSTKAHGKPMNNIHHSQTKVVHVMQSKMYILFHIHTQCMLRSKLTNYVLRILVTMLEVRKWAVCLIQYICVEYSLALTLLCVLTIREKRKIWVETPRKSSLGVLTFLLPKKNYFPCYR